MKMTTIYLNNQIARYLMHQARLRRERNGSWLRPAAKAARSLVKMAARATKGAQFLVEAPRL